MRLSLPRRGKCIIEALYSLVRPLRLYRCSAWSSGGRREPSVLPLPEAFVESNGAVPCGALAWAARLNSTDPAGIVDSGRTFRLDRLQARLDAPTEMMSCTSRLRRRRYRRAAGNPPALQVASPTPVPQQAAAPASKRRLADIAVRPIRTQAASSAPQVASPTPALQAIAPASSRLAGIAVRPISHRRPRPRPRCRLYPHPHRKPPLPTIPLLTIYNKTSTCACAQRICYDEKTRATVGFYHPAVGELFSG